MCSPIVIGRGNNVDLKLKDLSVSRSHAFIDFDDYFYLSDNNSKFGTVLLINNPIFVDKTNKLALRINRTILKFSVKTLLNINCWAFCCKKPSLVKIHPGRSSISLALDEQDLL